MQWTVYQFMGDLNPVCENAGGLEILVAPFSSPYFRADSIVFASSDNWQVLRRGFTCFSTFEDDYDWELHKYKPEVMRSFSTSPSVSAMACTSLPNQSSHSSSLSTSRP